MSEQVSDYDAIARVVQLYVDGGSKGDVGKLKEAFHEDARMFGDISGTRYDVPIRSKARWRVPFGACGAVRRGAQGAEGRMHGSDLGG